MRNTKHIPMPPPLSDRLIAKKTRRYAIHKHRPAGSKIGFHGGELTALNNKRAAMRRARKFAYP